MNEQFDYEREAELLSAENAVLRAELEVAESALLRKGYRKTCDIAACNCGSQWNHGGHAEQRLSEIGEALRDAGFNGGTLLGNIETVCAERDALEAEVAALRTERDTLKAEYATELANMQAAVNAIKDAQQVLYTTRDLTELAALQAENFALAAGQCVNATADDGGRPYCKELEALRSDAERYRWLRGNYRQSLALLQIIQFFAPEELDAAIDAARESGK